MCQIPCPGIKSFHKQIRKQMLKIVFDTKPPLEVKGFLKIMFEFSILLFCILHQRGEEYLICDGYLFLAFYI